MSFTNNRGHDYSNDAVGIKPAGWTMAQIKKAKFVIRDANNNVIDLVETLTRSTDAQGKISVEVLSSDIVSSDIEVKFQWKNAQDELKEVGSKICDFAEAVAKRRFPNQQDPEDAYPVEDNGWLFGQKYLVEAGNETTAKMYIKFLKDPKKGDVNGNWDYVNGHQMLFEIDNVDTAEGNIALSKGDYAILVGSDEEGAAFRATSGDGAATVFVRGGVKIEEANVISLVVSDQSQWTE